LTLYCGRAGTTVGLLWAQLPCGSWECLINIFLILLALVRGCPQAGLGHQKARFGLDGRKRPLSRRWITCQITCAADGAGLICRRAGPWEWGATEGWVPRVTVLLVWALAEFLHITRAAACRRSVRNNLSTLSLSLSSVLVSVLVLRPCPLSLSTVLVLCPCLRPCPRSLSCPRPRPQPLTRRVRPLTCHARPLARRAHPLTRHPSRTHPSRAHPPRPTA